MPVFIFDRVENIVGKGETACTSNFSFTHNVFKRLLSQTRQKVLLFGNGLTCYCTISSLNDLKEKDFVNIAREGENTGN